MAFVRGNAAFLVGAYNLSAYFRRISLTRTKELLDKTVFGDTANSFIEGLRSATMTATGLFEPTDDTQDERLNAAFTASSGTVISFGPNLTTIGNIAFVCNAWDKSYSIETPYEDLIQTNADITVDGDALLRGHWLHDLSAETAAESGTSVDNGATSTLGGRANLHVTAFNGVSAALKLQDSANNSVWADVTGGAFTSATGLTSESINISGEVRRYARYDLSGTFTSVTFALALGRRN